MKALRRLHIEYNVPQPSVHLPTPPNTAPGGSRDIVISAVASVKHAGLYYSIFLPRMKQLPVNKVALLLKSLKFLLLSVFENTQEVIAQLFKTPDWQIYFPVP